MLQNLFSSTRITFNLEIIETNELKKMYYYFGGENFLVTLYLCLFYAPYFGHTLTSKGTIYIMILYEFSLYNGKQLYMQSRELAHIL